MLSRISEFSYGFALTNELVGWAPVSAAPVFPSLIEEGKKGGGYDVKLQMPSVALYLQFKRSECMIGGQAKERKALGIVGKYYRFKIMEATKSDQHELLLALENGGDPTYYVAPRFHTVDEINDAWAFNEVAARSRFVRPNSIGVLDDKPHSVAFNRLRTWVCSEPKEIEGETSIQVLKRIEAALDKETKTLPEQLPEMIERLESARSRAEDRIAKRRDIQGSPIYGTRVVDLDDADSPDNVIPVRPSKGLSEAQLMIRKLADEAARTFDSQLVIVQRNEQS